MTPHLLRLAGLAVAISILLHSSTAGAGSVTRDDWVVWLERDAGTPPAAAMSSTPVTGSGALCGW